MTSPLSSPYRSTFQGLQDGTELHKFIESKRADKLIGFIDLIS